MLVVDELGKVRCVLGVDVLDKDGVVGARGLKCEVDGFGKTSREIGSV